uniref:Uncharacterized protein n=1 Tax=Arundo donax TaxID=35708 RepID=A0A0A9CH36_ARUDO
MRLSKLYEFADLDVGVPKKPLQAKEGAAAEVEAAPLFEPTPPWEEPPQPPMLPITVPRVMPKPPPGWKPGDPITLPLDGILPGIKGEEPHATVPPPHIALKQAAPTAQPIQVKAVQLDFESSSSDEYSSDVGSSEEDDED